MSGEDPVGEYLTEKQAAVVKRQNDDLQAWQQWNQADRNPQALQPLLARFEPTFTKKVKEWKAPTVSESAFRSNLKRQAIKAFESFDPAHPKAATLHTHVTGQLRKSLRFMKQHQNLAYIPEEKSGLIGHVQRASDELTGNTGVAPNHQMISQHLLTGGMLTPAQAKKMNPRMVKQVQDAQRKDLAASGFESDPSPRSAVTEREALGFLRETLTSNEQRVFDIIQKSPKVSGQLIAKTLSMSQSQVSRLRKSIAVKYKQGA